MIDPVPPTTRVWHAYHGDLVVVAAPGLPGFEVKAQQLENMKGPGTWTITWEAHVRALRSMTPKGTSPVGVEDFHWVPWSELKVKG